MLSAQQVSLTHGQIVRVDKVNLRCLQGNVTVLMGPNGAGKTSLLQLLSGEQAISHGDIVLNDRRLQRWRPQERAKMLAVLPQHSTLNFRFTVDEVVMLGRTPHDTGLRRDKSITQAALSAVDGRYLSSRYYPTLSGGEKQRVQLARVLAQIWEPAIIAGKEESRALLLDEPSSSFDLAHQQLLLKIVADVANQGIAVVMVLHDLNVAFRCADHLVLMKGGKITAQGATADIADRKQIASVFDVDVDIVPHPKTGRPLVII